MEETEVPASEVDEYPSRFMLLERRIKTVRQVELSRFLTEDAELDEFLSSHAKLQSLQHQSELLQSTKPLVSDDELFP